MLGGALMYVTIRSWADLWTLIEAEHRMLMADKPNGDKPKPEPQPQPQPSPPPDPGPHRDGRPYPVPEPKK